MSRQNKRSTARDSSFKTSGEAGDERLEASTYVPISLRSRTTSGASDLKINQAGFLMAKIHQTSSRIFSRMLRDENIEINPAQGRILFVLWQTDGVPIQELAKQTSLRKSTLTSMLDRLEDAGYIRRVASKTDRRKILIWRTQKDKDLQQQYDHISDKMGKIYYNGFNSQQMQRFDDDLRHILHNLESTEEQLF